MFSIDSKSLLGNLLEIGSSMLYPLVKSLQLLWGYWDPCQLCNWCKSRLPRVGFLGIAYGRGFFHHSSLLLGLICPPSHLSMHCDVPTLLSPSPSSDAPTCASGHWPEVKRFVQVFLQAQWFSTLVYRGRSVEGSCIRRANKGVNPQLTA